MISWLDQSSLVATLLHCRKALERIYILCSKAAKWDGAFFHQLWPIAVPRRSCLAAVTQQMDDLERYLKLSKIYWKIGPKNIKKLPNSVALPPGALPDLVDSRSLASASRGWFWRVRDSLLGGIISRFWCCWSDDSLIDLQGNHENLLQSSFNLWNVGRHIFVCDWYFRPFRPDLFFCFENPTLVKFEESPLKSKSIKSQEPFHNIFAQHLSI